MGLMDWGEKKIKKITFWDMGLIKFACILFGLILGAYASTFVKQYIWLFVILFLTGYITVIYRVLIKK